MSRPRYLANHDLTDAIVVGVKRREPSIDFPRLRELGMRQRPDDEVLAYAASQGLLVVSHDVTTMTAHASHRVASGLPMPGVFVSHQGDAIGQVIEDLVAIWAASDAEEWSNRIVFLPLR